MNINVWIAERSSKPYRAATNKILICYARIVGVATLKNSFQVFLHGLTQVVNQKVVLPVPVLCHTKNRTQPLIKPTFYLIFIQQ